MEALIGKGLFTASLLFIVLTASIYGSIRQGQRGVRFWLKKLPAVDAIEEAVGRSAETGTPLHATTGVGNMNTAVLAGLAVIAKAAKLCAQYGTQIIVTVCKPEVFPATQQTVQEAFYAVGKGDAFRPENVRFISPTEMAFVAGAIGIMNRERVAGNILIGSFSGEALLLAEAGAKLGAIQVSGSNNAKQLPFFVAVCDYTLIGEEMFAAGAYVSDDKAMAGCLRGQDIGKILACGLLLLGVVMRTAGSRFLNDLLSR